MCLDDQILNTYLDGELTEPFKSQVEEHLSYCTSCKSRFQKIKALSNTIQEAGLDHSEYASRQANVLTMIEKTCLNKKKPLFLKKILHINFPTLATCAAAFVFIFVGATFIVNKNADDFIPANFGNSVDVNNVNLVSDTSKGLSDYSLEEIMAELSNRGYDVDVRLKEVGPVEFTN